MDVYDVKMDFDERLLCTLGSFTQLIFNVVNVTYYNDLPTCKVDLDREFHLATKYNNVDWIQSFKLLCATFNDNV